MALGAQHQYQQAAQHWQRLLQLSPTHITAHLNLGLLYLRPLDDPVRAHMHLDAVLTLHPDHPQKEQIRAILQQR